LTTEWRSELSPKPNNELNKNQLLGRERTLLRMFDSTKSKISDLESKLESVTNELDEVQELIKEEEWISKGKQIYIVRSKRYTKGKVFYRGKYWWFHLGRTDKLSETSDDELKEMIRNKFYKSLITKMG